MTIKIVVVDDHKIFRESLKSLLEDKSDYKVIGGATDGHEGVKLVAKLRPDIVIMDVSMKGLNGIEAIRQINQKKIPVKMIALSMYSDKRFIIEAIKAGVSGYLLKDCAFEELARAINTVLGNQFYLSPNISNVIVKDYIDNHRKESKSIFSKLTSRECQTLQLLAEGKTTKEIASILEVSGKTIETYRLHIMNKLDIYSIAELTKYAIREGLTAID